MPRIIATDSCHRQQLIRATDGDKVQLMVANNKEDFARRLNKACDDAHPPIPKGRGRRAELRRRLIDVGLILSGESIRKWLCGDSIPSMDHIRHLSKTLNVETEWLLTGRERNNINTAPPAVFAIREPEAPLFSDLSQTIRDVVTLMLLLDEDSREKVLFAAQLAKHEFDKQQRQNSRKHAG